MPRKSLTDILLLWYGSDMSRHVLMCSLTQLLQGVVQRSARHQKHNSGRILRTCRSQVTDGATSTISYSLGHILACKIYMPLCLDTVLYNTRRTFKENRALWQNHHGFENYWHCIDMILVTVAYFIDLEVKATLNIHSYNLDVFSSLNLMNKISSGSLKQYSFLRNSFIPYW